MDPVTLESFCTRLPKVELHAHLNGSLSERTLHALYMENLSAKTDEFHQVFSSLQVGGIPSLDDCFKLFEIAHAVTTTPAAVKRSTKDVIIEFVDDGVMYLELRTTPRAVSGIMSKKDYVQAVIDAILDLPTYVSEGKFIIVKLLLSVNRRESLLDAEENIREALEAHIAYPDIVVGVDLSGNPSCGNVIDMLPLFSKARECGLKIALHCGEIPNQDEIEAILRFNADRLGHGTCIHPHYGGSEKLWNLLLKTKTPIEVCLTSNVKCKTVQNYESHHLQHLLPLHQAVVLSTDDKGVFMTTLSKEFAIAAQTFHLSAIELCNFTDTAIGVSFASPEEKRLLSSKLIAFKVQEGFE